jgi:hypothetical protein
VSPPAALRLLCAALVLSAAPAAAATISLTILAQPYVTSSGLDVHLDIRNNGDARALNVLPFAALRGEDAPGTLVPALEPDRSTLQTIRIPLSAPEKMRGVWPLIIQISYNDANHHPFEALHVVRVPFGPDQAADVVRLELEGATIETSGELAADIAAPAGTSVALTFIVPTGLAVAPQQAVVALTGSSRRMTGLLTNAGATAGSVLPVFAVAEYDIGDRHATAIAAATVTIEEGAQAEAPDPRTALRVAAFIVLVALLGVAARWPKSSRVG